MEANNLPQYATLLIGREAEISDIGDRLHNSRCRLLTLVGPGGIGKTRLAIEAASVQLRFFQDGVSFVSLQSVASVDNIVRTVASAIGYEFSAGSEPELQLQQHLRQKDRLLILDNLDHLLTAAGMIADLLSTTSHLKLLITSREPLNIQDEWLYHVEGLPFPEGEHSSEIGTYGAVRLFAERASRVQRRFSLEKEHAAVTQICQLVQGMPLGIELAANWCRRLPCIEIARELQNSLDILETDLRDVPGRHRSMRAVFDQSWKLLSDEERRVFMALSVFRGGFRRDAAEQVVGASLGVLIDLVDKSMLGVSRNGRYQIHELQRQYAAERLKESPELETAVCDQHSAYYSQFIDRPVSDFLRVGNQETLRAIDTEIDNIRSAWSWAITNQQPRNLDHAIRGLYWYTWLRAWHEEGEQAFSEAVAALRGVEPTAENQITLSRALYLQGAMDIWLGRPALAAERAKESQTILRPLDAQSELAEALNIQGWAAFAQEDWKQGKALLEESVTLYDTVDRRDQKEVKAFTYGLLGHIARAEGDYATGEYWYQKALRLGREIDDQRTIADALGSLGVLALRQGRYKQARYLCEQSLAVSRAGEMAPMVIGALHGLGGTCKAIGEFEAARDFFEEALHIAKEDGKGPSISGCHVLLADVMIAQGEYSAAQEQLQRALVTRTGMSDRWLSAAVFAGRGRIALRIGDHTEARRQHEASLALYREMRDRWGIIGNLIPLARIALAQGDFSQAAGYLVDSLQAGIKDGAPPLILSVLNCVAELFLQQNEWTESVHLATLVAQHSASDAESRELARTVLSMPEAALFLIEPGRQVWDDGRNDLKEVSAELLERLSSQPAQPLIEALSERELEILHMVEAGMSNRDIARDLTLAVGTVKSHLHNILQKLDASSRTQAVARARQLKLL